MQGCGGGKSDPVMTGFSGRSFNFFGDVGKTYNLISSMNHQLSMKLKLAQMWNHNGTNMEVCAPPHNFRATLGNVMGCSGAEFRHPISCKCGAFCLQAMRQEQGTESAG